MKNTVIINMRMVFATYLSNSTFNIINFSYFSENVVLQDVYFDDESAEVVISSLRLGDDQDRYTFLF